MEESDFKDAAPMLFGENFETIAKQHLEAAASLKKTLAPNKWKQGFWQGHPQQTWAAGVAKPQQVAREEVGNTRATKLSLGDDYLYSITSISRVLKCIRKGQFLVFQQMKVLSYHIAGNFQTKNFTQCLNINFSSFYFQSRYISKYI